MTAKLVTYKHYVAGWLDSTIHDFLAALSPLEASAKYSLITCLDSNVNPASVRFTSPELKPIAGKMQVVGNGLLVPTELLLEANSVSRLFFGFDEIWFFPRKRVQAKPPIASLVGPARVDEARLKNLGRWMEANSCSLALGGGEGLNFVIPANGLARFVLGYSIEQPEPSLNPA